MRLRTDPDYTNYLNFIFSSPQQLTQIGFQSTSLFNIRYAAAINLKNYIKTSYPSIPKASLAYIKISALNTLQDTIKQLRDFAGTIITEVVQRGGLLQWPEVLRELLDLVDGSGGNVSVDTQEGAMSALAKVCEDNRKMLEKDYQGQKPMTIIVPKLITYLGHSDARIRILSLKTLRTFISAKSPTMSANVDAYLGKIAQLTKDPDFPVRQFVCQSLVELVNSKPEVLVPHMAGLVDFILEQHKSSVDSPQLALDAAEFWLAVGEQDELRNLLRPYLDRVIPVLLAGMVYGEEDVEVLALAGQEDDANQEDRAEDIKPQFAAAKKGRGVALASKTNGTDSPSVNGVSTPRDDLSDGEIDDSEEEDDYYDDGEDPENEWSLRKCSAAALDVLAVDFGADVFHIILPYLMENLQHPKWPKREAAVLTLGAIAEGCQDIVAPHLPELVPFLISLLNDEEPVVRQITCWCLGRYSEWASHLATKNDKARFFEPMMQGLLERMLDRNKKVQEAAASAFASLEEKAGSNLTPYTEPILRRFTECFRQYKERNMYIIYDCIQTLADNVASELAKPQLVQILMPTLLERWNSIKDEEREIFPLSACLGYVAGAYGDVFATFAPPIFARCINIIYTNLREAGNYVADSEAYELPDPDFLVTSLDLLSAIIQAINPTKSAQLVSETQPPFFPLLSTCMSPTSPISKVFPADVRQSAYALLGDCAITIFSQLQPHISLLMPLLINQLSLDLIPAGPSTAALNTTSALPATMHDAELTEQAFNVLNNVCWSLGEIGAKIDPTNQTPPAQNPLAPYIDALYSGLHTIITTEDCPDTVNENASVALGRLGISCPQPLAPRLGDCAAAFLESVNKIAASEEKASAFIGFNKIVMLNPGGLGGEGVLSAWFGEAVSWPFITAAMAGATGAGGKAQNTVDGARESDTEDEENDLRRFAEVRESFGQVIRGFRTMFPENEFRAFLEGQLSEGVRERLRVGYAWALQ